ncbi:MAG: peptidoglycan DD-metalloendopeptidase family protein [Chloroflexi bacterium]|nr:peptidoglycan DD-metalloendopeptidase family protein [Chloroflexota bacterium]
MSSGIGGVAASPSAVPTRTLVPSLTPRPTLTAAPTPTASEAAAVLEATPTEAPGGAESPTPAASGETPEPSATVVLPAFPTSPPTATSVPPTATATLTARPAFQERTVEPGDSLSGIANAFGVSSDLIVSANRLPADGVIFVGQTLVIPREPGAVHIVVEGDSASEIALNYGVSLGAVVEANGLGDAGLIFIGQRLLLPGGRTPSPSPLPATATATAAPATATPVPATASPTLLPRTPTTAVSGTPTIAPVGRGGPGARLRWPAVAGLSQLFGEQGHTGIDIMADMGAPITAAADGLVVVVADSDIGYGKRVEIDHGGGVSTLYAHLSAFSVSAGQRVTAGQRLGAVGDTGFSFGPHLHFEVRLNGVPADPLPYLP